MASNKRKLDDNVENMMESMMKSVRSGNLEQEIIIEGGEEDKVQEPQDGSELIPVYDDDPDPLKSAKQQVNDLQSRMRDCNNRLMEDLNNIFNEFMNDISTSLLDIKKQHVEQLEAVQQLHMETVNVKTQVEKSASLTEQLGQTILASFK